MVRLSLFLILALAAQPAAAAADELTDPAHRLAPNDPAWNDVTAAFAQKPDATAAFSEQRFFPFKKEPVELTGEVRIASARGLSLHYLKPEERTVIFDGQGTLLREAGGESAPPSDPRANFANAALVQVLRFDLAALAGSFEVFGQRDGKAWTLALVPRAEELRRAVSEIIVAGEAAEVHRIAIRRTPKQSIEILVGPAKPTPFTPAELKRFFR